MSCKVVRVVLAMVLIVSICGGTMAQLGCTNALMGMSSCLNYITGNSSTPSSSCCSQLANIVEAQPQCLCSALNENGISLSININRTVALSLPGACNVQTPPVSECKDTTSIPAASPKGYVTGPNILPDSPTELDSPSGLGSKTDGSIPNESESRAPAHLLAFVLLGMSWVSIAFHL